ncbi:MAG: carboxypeptidase-like regulatory domain-containing protein, partial [Pyrinomonadaceae bacterium]
ATRFNRKFSRYVLVVVFLGVGILSPRTTLGQSGIARPQTTANPTIAGQSTVKGRVVYKNNAQPLKGINVRIFSASSGGSNGPDKGIVAFTNNRGEFLVDNLAAGKYYVTVEG